MKLSDYTITFLSKAIAGDMEEFPYRKGPELVSYFNEFGFHDAYSWGGGFPTRRIFAEDKLRELNGSELMPQVVVKAVDPRAFLQSKKEVSVAVARLNEVLKFDGYELVPEGHDFKLRDLAAGRLKLDDSARVQDTELQSILDENIRKCETKLSTGDYSGVITNARSFIESVLLGIEHELDSSAAKYDGELQKLYKRVQNHLNLEPDRKDVSEPLRQVLGGLAGIVSGLGAVRNKMSDSHAAPHKPAKRHAKLAYHAAVTLADFLLEARDFQKQRDKPEAH